MAWWVRNIREIHIVPITITIGIGKVFMTENNYWNRWKHLWKSSGVWLYEPCIKKLGTVNLISSCWLVWFQQIPHQQPNPVRMFYSLPAMFKMTDGDTFCFYFFYKIFYVAGVFIIDMTQINRCYPICKMIYNTGIDDRIHLAIIAKQNKPVRWIWFYNSCNSHELIVVLGTACGQNFRKRF